MAADNPTQGSSERIDLALADRLKARALRAIDRGDIALGWYLYGQADRARGKLDPVANTDELYGEEYRCGYGGKPQP